jgi:hypothetical protein
MRTLATNALIKGGRKHLDADLTRYPVARILSGIQIARLRFRVSASELKLHKARTLGPFYSFYVRTTHLAPPPSVQQFSIPTTHHYHSLSISSDHNRCLIPPLSPTFGSWLLYSLLPGMLGFWNVPSQLRSWLIYPPRFS